MYYVLDINTNDRLAVAGGEGTLAEAVELLGLLDGDYTIIYEQD